MSSTVFSTNTWYHVAVARSSGTTKIFVNGSQENTSTSSYTVSTGGNLYIGAGWYNPSGREITGKLSNVRLTKGQALYTSNFLPPTEDLTTTSQGATASNVKLLTCQSYKIQDNSPSPLTLTVNGTAAPSTDAPFVTSGAGSFDGTGDYLSVPASSEFAFGTGDFTVEYWVYSNSLLVLNNAAYVTDFRGGNTNNFTFGIINSGGTLKTYSWGNSVQVVGSTSLSTNTWYHIAHVRNGSTVTVYLNGSSDGSMSNSFNQSSTGLIIGARHTTTQEYVNGFISNLRITKGLARYTANFTPPTEDFDPTDQDTTFLALQGNTLDDLSGNDHAVTANGDAATSTISPFEPVDGSDAMLDSPTNYGSGDLVRGNYCTLNPLDTSANSTFSEGNLKVITGTSEYGLVRATIGVISGKWYWEVVQKASGTTNNTIAGIAKASATLSSYLGADAGGWGYIAGGNKITNNSQTAYGAGWTNNDVIGIAFDADAGTLTFYKNGTTQGTAFTGLTSGPYFPALSDAASLYNTTIAINFGQQPFKYPLAGYKSLCSTNLPTPAVADGSTAMDVVTWTGTGGTQTFTGLEFSPDLIWHKIRSISGGHQLYDSVRGATNRLDSSSTAAESTVNGVSSFTSDGWVTSGGNNNGENYVSWTWDAGSSTVSNTDGTITSQVRANPTAGFSVVSYTGTGSAGTVGHGLAKTPGMIILKSRDSADAWPVWHKSFSSATNNFLQLEKTDSIGTVSNYWNSSAPDATTFGLGAGGFAHNLSGDGHIAYCFAPVEGYSAFGSYTGNGSADGPFVYTGFRPRWVLLKCSSTGGANYSWRIWDASRDTYNAALKELFPNLSSSEGAAGPFDILSNGFKLRDSFSGRNENGATYIYAAFAEHPFKTSRAR